MFHSHPLPSLSALGRVLCVCVALVSLASASDSKKHFAGLEAELAEDRVLVSMVFAKGIKENDTGAMEDACRNRGVNPNEPILGLHPSAFALQADSSNAVLDCLLSHGVKPNAIMPGMEFTPLTLAVAQGKERAVRYLLGRRDVEINVPNASGRNALGLAVVFYREAALWVLDRGGNPLQVDDKGMTPWGLAIQSKVPDLMVDAQDNKILISKVVPHDMDIIVSMLRHAPTCVDSTFKWIIDMVNGKDTNKAWRREDTFTALAVAAAMGNEELVRLLYSHKAALDEQSTIFKLTPLMAALSTRHENTARMLVKFGADLTCTDKEGWNAVIHAVAADLPDAITFLHEEGASLDPVVITHNGKATTLSPFQMAIATGKEKPACQIARLMPDCDKPIAIDVQTGSEEFVHLEMPPLFLAIDAGLPSVVGELLQRKAKVDIVCPNKFNPLAHAVFMPDITDEARIAMYKLLVQAGATTDGVDQEIADGIKEWKNAAFPDGLPS